MRIAEVPIVEAPDEEVEDLIDRFFEPLPTAGDCFERHVLRGDFDVEAE